MSASASLRLPVVPVPALPQGAARRVAAAITRAASRSMRRSSRPATAFAAELAPDQGLAIDDGVGCTLRVVEGQAWITFEGQPDDVIANAGDDIALPRDTRTYVSAFGDAVVLATPLAGPRGVAYAMGEDFGLRILRITVERDPLDAMRAGISKAWDALADAYVAYAERRFKARLNAY
jgi:hypothetical protein